MNVAKQIQMEMIEADLQQAWEFLQRDQINLGIHHLEKATQKARDMGVTLADQPAEPKQLTIDIQ